MREGRGGGWGGEGEEREGRGGEGKGKGMGRRGRGRDGWGGEGREVCVGFGDRTVCALPRMSSDYFLFPVSITPVEELPELLERILNMQSSLEKVEHLEDVQQQVGRGGVGRGGEGRRGRGGEGWGGEGSRIDHQVVEGEGDQLIQCKVDG